MTKPKHIYSLAEGEPLSAGRKKNECRNERHPVGVESESLRRAEIRAKVFQIPVRSLPEDAVPAWQIDERSYSGGEFGWERLADKFATTLFKV